MIDPAPGALWRDHEEAEGLIQQMLETYLGVDEAGCAANDVIAKLILSGFEVSRRVTALDPERERLRERYDRVLREARLRLARGDGAKPYPWIDKVVDAIDALLGEDGPPETANDTEP